MFYFKNPGDRVKGKGEYGKLAALHGAEI